MEEATRMGSRSKKITQSGLVGVLARDLGGVYRCSVNLHESAWTKTKRLIWTGVYLCKAFGCGLSAMRCEKLGSRVLGDGKLAIISNWAGSDFPTVSADGFYEERVSRDRIRNIRNAAEYWHRFVFGVSFYTSNWMNIDIQSRLYG